MPHATTLLYIHDVGVVLGILARQFYTCLAFREARLPMPPSRTASTSEIATPLTELTQARYERQLLNEISKLQQAIAEERAMTSAAKAAEEAAVAEEKAAKANASEKASKLHNMELAIEAAQKEEQRAFLKRRAKDEARLAQKAAEEARERAIEVKKREQARQMAHQLHQDQLKRTAEEREAMAESKRMQDAMKEQKLRERLAAERQSQLEKNLLKADEAQAKVERAAQQRIAMTAQQRADYAVRMEAQQRRVEEQQAERERKMAEIKAHGEQKQAEIVRAIEQQKALQEARKQAIMQQEAKKNAELDAKAERERQLRGEAIRERQLQEAASRGRVERTMGELQSQLESLEGQLEARTAKVDEFCNNRHGHMELAQKLAVAGALERAMMSNSMAKMRQNLSSEGMASLRLEIPTERREVHNPELKALLQRLDPAGAGEVPLAQMKKTLTKLLPPPEEFGGQRPKRIGSQSMPSLSASLDALQLSRYERAVAAFKKIDADDSGTISKRELYEVLKTAGLSNGKQALEVFKGADADNDGQLNFEEFEKIAKAIC